MTSAPKGKADDQYSEEEAGNRRDAVIKHMLNMPPKPHSEMKLGKPKGVRGKKLRREAKSTT